MSKGLESCITLEETCVEQKQKQQQITNSPTPTKRCYFGAELKMSSNGNSVSVSGTSTSSMCSTTSTANSRKTMNCIKKSFQSFNSFENQMVPDTAVNNAQNRLGFEDPFYAENSNLLDAIKDCGEKIRKNMFFSPQEIESLTQKEIYGVAFSKENSPNLDLEDVQMEKIEKFLSPTKWSFRTPEGRRIRRIHAEPTVQKPYLWVKPEEKENKMPRKKSENEVNVITSARNQSKPSGLYEFAVNVTHFTTRSCVNIDAHCKPVFQIVNDAAENGKPKPQVIAGDAAGKSEEEQHCFENSEQLKPEEDPLFEFLAKTQRRPEKQKRRSSFLDLLPKRLSFTEGQENSCKRLKNDRPEDDLGCNVLNEKCDNKIIAVSLNSVASQASTSNFTKTPVPISNRFGGFQFPKLSVAKMNDENVENNVPDTTNREKSFFNFNA